MLCHSLKSTLIVLCLGKNQPKAVVDKTDALRTFDFSQNSVFSERSEQEAGAPFFFSGQLLKCAISVLLIQIRNRRARLYGTGEGTEIRWGWTSQTITTVQ